MSNTNLIKAFVLVKPGHFEWQERPMPRPEPGQALIRTKKVGICGSDIHAYRGRQPSLVTPCILGHEILGEVVETNYLSSLNSPVPIEPGDRVVVDPKIACQNCYACSINRENICENLKILSVHVDGGLTEYFLAGLEQLYRVPERVSEQEAVLAEPLSIGAQAIERGRVGRNEQVVILGAGPIGLTTLVLAKEKGARVAMLDLWPNRLAAAKNIGADLVINVNAREEEEVLKQIKEFCSGHGPEVLIDAAAVQKTAKLAIKALARTGRLVVLGMAKPDVWLPYLPILKKELDIIGSRMATNHQFSVVLDFFQRSKWSKILSEQLVTAQYPFRDVQSAIEFSEKHPEKAIKVIIDFESED